MTIYVKMSQDKLKKQEGKTKQSKRSEITTTKNENKIVHPSFFFILAFFHPCLLRRSG